MKAERKKSERQPVECRVSGGGRENGKPARERFVYRDKLIVWCREHNRSASEVMRKSGKRNEEILLLSLDGVLELEDGEVEFNRCLGIAGLQALVKNIRDNFTASLHESFLLCLIFDN